MPQDEEILRLLNGAVEPKDEGSGEVDIDDPNEVIERMRQLLGRSVMSFMGQNVREADLAARAAIGLYTAVNKKYGAQDLRPLQIMANTVAIYAPLTRTFVFQSEARYTAALAETIKTRAIAAETLTVIAGYVTSPDAEPEAQRIFQPMLMMMEILNDFLEMQIRGELAAYRGDVGTYLQMLRDGVALVHARLETIPPSNDDQVHGLVVMCVTLADRMNSRFENLSKEPPRRYLQPIGNKVFIVHGHDEAKWRELRDLLRDRFKLEPVVLKEEATGGATLIAKFEEYADQSCYAFVLLTPDDFVEKDGKKYLQARPNALFELGWFCGHFGRDHVSIIKKGDTALPSDLNGLVTIDFTNNISEAVVMIEAELKRMGISKQPKRKPRAKAPRAAPRSLG